MSELELVGLDDEGDHLVLRGHDGQRFRLPIDEALRAAVRRDRPQLEQLRADRANLLPPREIQARIRSGGTAEDVAAAAGMPVEHVRRYEGPVLAEREYVAGQARGTRIGHDASSPVLGDLVTDRLATRGVAADGVEWDATRGGSGPWTVEVRFPVGDDVRCARWRFDAAARTLKALDDEARWLSETDLGQDGPVPRRHLAAVRPELEVDGSLRPLLASVDRVPEPAAPVEPVEPEPDPRAETEALLEDLADRRGVRQELDVEAEDDDEFEGFGPQQTFDFEHPGRTAVPPAHPPASRPEEATDATVLSMPAGRSTPPAVEPSDADAPSPADAHGADDDDAGETTDVGVPGRATHPDEQHDPQEPPRPARSRSRKGRASVPSWDEIVFGAKQD